MTYDQTPKPDWELSRDELAERYQRIHLWAIREFIPKVKRNEYDWESEFLMVLARCLNHYDPARKNQFSTFFYYSAMHCRAEYFKSRQKRFEYTMVNVCTKEETQHMLNRAGQYQHRYVEKLIDDEDFAKVINLMSPSERESVLRELGFTSDPILYKLGPKAGQPLSDSEATKRYNDAVYQTQRRLGLRPRRDQKKRKKAKAK